MYYTDPFSGCKNFANSIQLINKVSATCVSVQSIQISHKWELHMKIIRDDVCHTKNQNSPLVEVVLVVEDSEHHMLKAKSHTWSVQHSVVVLQMKKSQLFPFSECLHRQLMYILMICYCVFVLHSFICEYFSIFTCTEHLYAL